ncbi:MAG TPA: vitamin B12-dependent ribonucleotide reductase [candidate division Zixibacteria bacterium]|nr:vitamin B12-dependent ribonucleotide reductase [candidate division Zixibacteria bacterium]
MQTREIHMSPNAMAVMKRRYLARDASGRVIETPVELFVRVARAIAEADRVYGGDDAQVERTAQAFFNVMADGDFLPNSPTLMNAGRALGQLSACFVLPVGDSMEEIFEAVKQAALIHKSGGGTGFAFSRLRPRNARVRSTSGVASGPVSFMEVFNHATEAVKQGGTRRGANMGILRVDHPDIREFISCKLDTGRITNFNISVAVTNAFMEALEADSKYALVNPQTGQAHVVEGEEQWVPAREIFDLIVEQAWLTGEPGIVFIDRMNEGNPTFPFEQIEATNPCGEQPLPPYDSCNLGSINLGRFAREPLPGDYAPSDPAAGVDWERLAGVVRTGVHFLDNVIDQNKFPIPEIAAQTRRNRRIGLGVMGWADLLVRLRVPYNSEAAFALGERVMQFVHSEARNHSSELAKTRGKFPNWEHSLFGREGIAMRNATVTTVAPTGTISILAGCSSGIEPYYAVAFERNIMEGTRLTEVNPLFEAAARRGGFYSDDLIRKVAERRSISDLAEIPEELRATFLTAADISPEDHIRMQAQFQKHCDSSVSKTINFAESATREAVRTAFRQAYRMGLKGITIYRDNARPNQVLSARPAAGATVAPVVMERPAVLEGITEKIRTGYGNLYVTVNTRQGQPFEVIAHIVKSGYTTMADTEAICRLISLALRSHVPVEAIIRQLRGIGGASQTFSGGARVASIPDAIAQVLHRHSGAEAGVRGGAAPEPDGEICPECGGLMHAEAGCFSCGACGYSNC